MRPLLLVLLAASCAQPRSAPAPHSASAPQSATPEPPGAPVPPPASVAPPPAVPPVPPPPPSAPSAADAGPVDAAVPTPDALLDEKLLLDPSGAPLPQTDERPTTTSPAFQRRMALLFQAIAADDPKLATRVFFPLVAYRQVKDIADPDRDWQRRLMRAFERSIHDYHRTIGNGATLLSVEVPEARARFMPPRSEGNKLSYWRVLRTQLRVRTAQGHERTLDVTSLISWRGEWYVVHLDGFK
jgi:hypothetical protein